MIPTRESPASAANERLQSMEPQTGEGNVAWLERCPVKRGVLLLGGTSLADFRLRVAQSQLRSDLTPSYWSLCGLLLDGGTFESVPLQFGDISDVPSTNGVRRLSVAEVDDARRWPNIAVLAFVERPEVIEGHAQRVLRRRTIIDLPELIVAWLAYSWAAGSAENPLLEGRGIPSAAFVEAAHSLAGVELTPSLSSAASCPEAIWQAVKWWHEYYEGAAKLGVSAEAGLLVPTGRYALRQRSAAVELAPDAPLFLPGPGEGRKVEDGGQQP
ncbi:MAG TPA: hypothetical protein VMP67_04590 [Candidatus Limnocylindria bacterium]|nr:hypothetical protein [Candidatus Limnocylindria bacterium]